MNNQILIKKVAEKKYTLITDKLYSKVKLNNKITVIVNKRYEKQILKHNLTSISDLLIFLRDNIDTGIYIVCLSDTMLFFNSFLCTELSYYEDKFNFYISDSALTLANTLGFKLSKEAIAVQLISGLPYFPFHTLSLWENINKLNPLSHLIINKYGEVSLIENPIDTNKYPPRDLEKIIKESLLDTIQSSLEWSESVSLDVSGGIDSAVLVYLLKTITNGFSAYHSSSTENSDTKWANFISENLDHRVKILESIKSNNKRFDIDSSYLESNIPELPLLWSDTEGYIIELVKYINEKTNVHLVGIGGDDLFSPMPAAPWAIVKNGGYKGLKFLFKYSLHSKANFIVCMRSFFDNIKYSEELRQNLDLAFCKNSKQSSLLFPWNEKINVPSWITYDIKDILYNFLVSIANENAEPFNKDRSKNQIIQSLIFQKKVLSQLNVISKDSTHWCAPFLNFSVIEQALCIPDIDKYNPVISKPFLYKMMNKTMPDELFYRGSKGDYSSTVYESYRTVKNTYNNYLEEFELVKLGIIDVDTVRQELSMPTANPTRIDGFAKICATERWLRQIKNKYGELYKKNYE